MGKRKQKIGIGAILLVFGLGLALAFTIPAKALVVVLSFALAASGVELCKCCQEENNMKFIVFDNPKVIGGLLRMVFGIKREVKN